MVIIKTSTELDKLRESARIVAIVHEELKEVVQPGITTLELNDIAEKRIRKEGGIPAFIGYQGFPYTICASINEVIVHGFPSIRKLEEGDLLSIDVGVYKDGYNGDAAFTVVVGEMESTETISNETRVISDKAHLVLITRKALEHAVSFVKEGVTTGTIGNIIETTAHKYGYSVVRNYIGHGIGRNLHEEPSMYNFGRVGTGVQLKAGMCICIEPMLVAGDASNHRLKDGWSVVTDDGSLSAHEEHQVIVHKNYGEVISI